MIETTAESISNFIRWAEQRLAKEVEENERVEAKAGTREFILGSGNAKKQDFTQEEKIAIVKEIDDIREQGYKPIVGASKFGIHTTTYYKWKKQIQQQISNTRS